MQYLGHHYTYQGDRAGCAIFKGTTRPNEFLITEAVNATHAIKALTTLLPERKILSSFGGMETGKFTLDTSLEETFYALEHVEAHEANKTMKGNHPMVFAISGDDTLQVIGKKQTLATQGVLWEGK
jgi:hypothetical protein